MEVQNIGLDVGRGYVKCYSEYNRIKKESLFKSVFGDGRSIDFTNYESPIYIEFDGQEYFVGLIAEKESFNQVRNSRDSKTSIVVKTLIAAALSEIAISDKINIMLGVPYKSFRKAVMSEIIECYKGKVITVKDLIKGGTKRVLINDISIFREADAALHYTLKNVGINNKPVGLASIGFRTTEFAYFDTGLKFSDKLSKSIETGNKTVLTTVQDRLKDKGIMKELNEIDTSSEYKDLKDYAYSIASENIAQQIEDLWINYSEMDIYIAGGTSLNMHFDSNVNQIEEAQMATAKGLYLIAERKFK